MADRREQLLNIVKREMIGPDPIDILGLVQPNGEEILTTDPPLSRYIAGILYPYESTEERIESPEDSIIEDLDDPREAVEREQDVIFPGNPSEYLEEAEELIDRSNAYLPSAMSLTVAVQMGDSIRLNVSAGRYVQATLVVDYTSELGGEIIELQSSSEESRLLVEQLIAHVNDQKFLSKKSDDTLLLSSDEKNNKLETSFSKDVNTDNSNRRVKNYYFRIPIDWDNNDSFVLLPDAEIGMSKIDSGLGFQVSITYRYSTRDRVVYTFTLENKTENTFRNLRDEDCFFQTRMTLSSKLGFKPIPENPRINTNEHDYWSNQLLYKDIQNYSIGHGCSTNWDDSSERVSWISTATFPSYEMKPIVPKEIPGVSLDMLEMSDKGNIGRTVSNLRLLASQYKQWIYDLNKESELLEGQYKETALKHIEDCETCYSRMIRGIELIENDEEVRLAFQLMNRAMLMQQLHYNLPLQQWKFNDNNQIELENPITRLPEIQDKTTWYDSENRIYGKWRSFQIAFILMNLDSMSNESSVEREIVDLIWFPTGGGKTEAYLGLSAYTIFIRRIRTPNVLGTSIIMRYTLRLLTAQQYERASAMICACDQIREENSSLLGTERITIGLWVGGTTTPNKMADAVRAFNDLMNAKGENMFGILKCPWCGAQMGVVDNENNSTRFLPGYRSIKEISGKRRVIFQCYNNLYNCAFSKDENPLPLQVIDEDIYEKPPTLLLGTVDKFARLPFEPRSQTIFGIFNGKRVTSPDLIIQDELHLISGPLGSMVGHYETMINELCSYEKNGQNIYPKIIASTATISRAKEQCHALYGCGKENVFQFPPSGLSAGDSFFSEEDRSLVGRKYVGIMALGRTSDTTAAIRLYSALLYAAKEIEVGNESERDPYWTNVGYYNSLRELGQAATWINADIEQYLDSIYKRRLEHKIKPWKLYNRSRRYIYRSEELTSRIANERVTGSLANLNLRYQQPEGSVNSQYKDRPIDICLATNMISVGLDVPRLGLMTISGQPKTTSEYIQASSRIGRDGKNAPGIVFVLYRPGRPRDKSHYEQFISYHSRIYSNVEPTSVTPFSPQVRDRALHALIVGIIRLLGDETFNKNPPPTPDEDMIQYIHKIISERVRRVDLDELESTIDKMKDIFDRWEDWNPELWSANYLRSGAFGHQVPLIYPSGKQPNDEWGGRGIVTPNSMRNVDASCEAYVLNRPYQEME